MLQEHAHLANFTGLQGLKDGVPVDPLPFGRGQPNTVPARAHDEVAARRHHLFKGRGTSVGAIANNDVALAKRNTKEAFTAASVANLQMREPRKRRFVGGVQPPVRAGTAGVRDRTAIDDAQPTPRRRGTFDISVFQQGACDAAKPIGRSTQALQKSNIGKARNVVHPGPGGRRAQAHPAGAIGQGQTQQCRCVRNIATTYQRSRRSRRRVEINTLRQPRDQSLPVAFNGIIPLHLA
ncbi:MAG: hypothetical protein E5W95_32155 [Mesorhizobium sp.]|nr:MAG: hypothetical protein E5W95_32155 [Mesorhizobium sp.]